MAEMLQSPLSPLATPVAEPILSACGDQAGDVIQIVEQVTATVTPTVTQVLMPVAGGQVPIGVTIVCVLIAGAILALGILAIVKTRKFDRGEHDTA